MASYHDNDSTEEDSFQMSQSFRDNFLCSQALKLKSLSAFYIDEPQRKRGPAFDLKEIKQTLIGVEELFALDLSLMPEKAQGLSVKEARISVPNKQLNVVIMGHQAHGSALELYGLSDKQALISQHAKEIIPNRQFCIWEQTEDPRSRQPTGDDMGELPLVVNRYFADLNFEAPLSMRVV